MTWGVDRATVPPDVQRAIIDALAKMALTSAGAAVTVRASYPATATPEAPKVPALTVVDLGASSYSALIEPRLIQVTAWATQPTAAKHLASVARGRLLALHSDGDIRSVLPATILAPTADPETGYWLAAFTVRVVARSH